MVATTKYYLVFGVCLAKNQLYIPSIISESSIIMTYQTRGRCIDSDTMHFISHFSRFCVYNPCKLGKVTFVRHILQTILPVAYESQTRGADFVAYYNRTLQEIFFKRVEKLQ